MIENMSSRVTGREQASLRTGTLVFDSFAVSSRRSIKSKSLPYKVTSSFQIRKAFSVYGLRRRRRRRNIAFYGLYSNCLYSIWQLFCRFAMTSFTLTIETPGCSYKWPKWGILLIFVMFFSQLARTKRLHSAKRHGKPFRVDPVLLL